MVIYKDPAGDIYRLWFVNRNGKLRSLNVPFRAICIIPAKDIKINTVVYVEAVVGTESGQLVYFIFNKPYLYFHFHVDIQY